MRRSDDCRVLVLLIYCNYKVVNEFVILTIQGCDTLLDWTTLSAVIKGCMGLFLGKIASTSVRLCPLIWPFGGMFIEQYYLLLMCSFRVEADMVLP